MIVYSFTEEEWENEWQLVVHAASRKKMSTTSYQPLEAVHIFTLANILGRAIIIIASPFMRDVHGMPLQVTNIGGIYLPYLRIPEECSKMPIIICYDQMHFSAICPKGHERIMPKIPIEDINKAIMPLRFSVDPPPNFDWTKFEQVEVEDQNIVFQKYLDDLPKFTSGSFTNSPMFVALRANVHWGTNVLMDHYVVELENHFLKHLVEEPTTDAPHRTTPVMSPIGTPRVSSSQEVKRQEVQYFQKGSLKAADQPGTSTGHVVKKTRTEVKPSGECSFVALKDVNVFERAYDIERALCNITIKGTDSNEAICGDLTDERDSDFSDMDLEHSTAGHSAGEPARRSLRAHVLQTAAISAERSARKTATRASTAPAAQGRPTPTEQSAADSTEQSAGEPSTHSPKPAEVGQPSEPNQSAAATKSKDAAQKENVIDADKTPSDATGI